MSTGILKDDNKVNAGQLAAASSCTTALVSLACPKYSPTKKGHSPLAISAAAAALSSMPSSCNCHLLNRLTLASTEAAATVMSQVTCISCILWLSWSTNVQFHQLRPTAAYTVTGVTGVDDCDACDIVVNLIAMSCAGCYQDCKAP